LTGKQCPFRYRLAMTTSDGLFKCSGLVACGLFDLSAFGVSSCLLVAGKENAVYGCLLAKALVIIGIKLSYSRTGNRVIAPNALLNLDDEENERRKDKARRKIGIAVAMLQLGASVAWFMNNFVAMTEGAIPAGQAAIPAMFLIEGLILFFILRGES
jgi:hypothetical protein